MAAGVTCTTKLRVWILNRRPALRGCDAHWRAIEITDLKSAAMSKLRNWRWERFAQEVAAGGDPRDAYMLVGYKPDRANHNRLLRRTDVAGRIHELKHDRIEAARAVGMSAPAVLAALKGHGIERLADFFESAANFDFSQKKDGCSNRSGFDRRGQ